MSNNRDENSPLYKVHKPHDAEVEKLAQRILTAMFGPVLITTIPSSEGGKTGVGIVTKETVAGLPDQLFLDAIATSKAVAKRILDLQGPSSAR